MVTPTHMQLQSINLYETYFFEIIKDKVSGKLALVAILEVSFEITPVKEHTWQILDPALLVQDSYSIFNTCVSHSMNAP